ncbi:MAG TPA: efflux RND transporter periplasmic adaptor subunit [Solirubrobacter sp.]|nr:efflux RND transporter periplasmic adaptor subunit [Solirubrobacter sp.]
MPTRTKRRPVKPAAPSRPRSRSARHRPRPGALTALLLAAACAAVLVAVLSLRSAPAATVSERTVTVSRGVVESVVSGSGNLEPANQLDVSFGTSGKIVKVYVKAGAHVSAGELLGRLDDRSAEVAVAKAQADLADAQDALTNAQNGTSTPTASAGAASGGAATANAASASAASAGDAATVRTLSVAYVAQVTPTETAAPEEGTPAATATPAPTETPAGEATPAPTATPRKGATPQATPTPTSAAPSAPSGSGGGRSSGGGGAPSGSSSGGGSSGGGATQSVASAQAAVASAKLALDEAQDALDDTRLRAPVAGTVAAVNNAVGDTVGGGTSGSTASDPFVVLAQLSKLKLEVQLSESDIGKVQVGQSAAITVNAASGEKVSGRVTSVGVLSTDATSSGSGAGGGASSSSGAVSYPVVITLDQTTDGLKAGMSATADIVVERVSGLSVPSQALRGSTATVERKDGSRETVRVQTGVVGDSSTQVLSGLEEGDEVIVTSTSATLGQAASGRSQQQQRGFGGGGFGGGVRGGAGFPGGGFPGGGPPGGPGG